MLKAWLVTRGQAVKYLTIKDLMTWSENSDEGEIAILSSGIIPKIFTPCQARFYAVVMYSSCLDPATSLSPVQTLTVPPVLCRQVSSL